MKRRCSGGPTGAHILGALLVNIDFWLLTSIFLIIYISICWEVNIPERPCYCHYENRNSAEFWNSAEFLFSSSNVGFVTVTLLWVTVEYERRAVSGFNPRPGHTQEGRNGPHCLPALHWVPGVKLGALDSPKIARHGTSAAHCSPRGRFWFSTGCDNHWDFKPQIVHGIWFLLK